MTITAKTDTTPRVRVRRLNEAIGAEVTGLDVTSLTPDQFTFCREALQEHHLLCFRDQNLDERGLMAFASRWGELETFPEEDKTKVSPAVFNISNLSATGEQLPETDPQVIFHRIASHWHTDSSWRYIPSFASFLFGVEVLPPEAVGGETEFANMLLAYEALSDADKQLLEPLHMVHYHDYSRRVFPQIPPLSHAERNAIPPVSQPLVRVHPDRDGRRSLYITANSGREVSGMTLEEGQALHSRLVEHATQPSFTYKHRWKKNDLVVWDNRVLLHRAVDYERGRFRRDFRRTVVAGKGPVLGPYSNPVRNRKPS